MRADYEDERMQLENESLKDSIERERQEFEVTKQCRRIDLHSMEQEVYRRNIEACMNVLRLELTDKNHQRYIGVEVRTLAEEKVKEFLHKLSVLSYDDSVE